MAADYEQKELNKPEQYDSWFNPVQTRAEYESDKLFEIKGFPFPVDRESKRGFFYKAVNHEVIKSDLLQLLLTEPGERVMLPYFGTGLRRMMFEQKDSLSGDEMRSLIIDAIARWEPRIVVHEVSVKFGDAGRDSRFASKNPQQDPHDSRVIVPGDNVDTNSFIVRIVYSLKNDLEGIENLVFRINYNEPILN